MRVRAGAQLALLSLVALAGVARAQGGSARCAVAILDDGSHAGVVERIRSEIALSTGCAERLTGGNVGSRPVVLRVLSEQRFALWEHGRLVEVLSLSGSDDVIAVKLAEHIRARMRADRTLLTPTPSATPVGSPSVSGATAHPPPSASPTPEPKPPASATSVPISTIRSPRETPLPRQPAPSPEPFGSASPPSRRWTLAAASRFGFSLDAGAFGGLWDLEVGLFGALPVALSATLRIPIAPSTLEDVGQRAKLSPLGFGVSAAYPFVVLPRRWSARIGLGLLLTHLSVEGIAQAPLVGQSQSTWSPLLVMNFANHVSITENIGIELASSVGFAPEPVPVYFDGREIASFGAPSLTLSIGPRVDF